MEWVVDGGHTESVDDFFFPVHIFGKDLRLNVFTIFRCNLNACVSTARRGPEGVRVVAPPEPGMLGSPPDRGRWS